MAYEWAVIVLDPTNGNAEQSVRHYWDASVSKFQPIAHYRPEQADWRLRFPSTTFLNIREGFPFMAGYRDPATRLWDRSREVYCGQIGRQTGSGLGRDHILLDLLDDWAVALSDAGITHWPNRDFQSVVPSGYSLWQWLVGTPATGFPYQGLVPDCLNRSRIDFQDGVDPIFDTMIITDTYMPSLGKSVVFGAGQFCTLKDAIDTLLAVARFINEGCDPVAFIQPVVNPADQTQVIPRFRLINRNDTSGPSQATFSISPTVGQYAIEQPASHERDIRPSKQRIRVVGKGGDPTLPGNPLVFVDYYNPAHSDQYPAWLNDQPGRVLYIVDDRIETLAAATQIARSYEAVLYGPTGRITFRSAHFVTPGDIITVYWPQEGLTNQRFPVAGVKMVPNPGRPLYDITIGEPAPDLRILIDRVVNSSLNDTAPITLTTALALGPGHSFTPKSSRQALDGAPHTTAQNTTRARGRDVVPITIRGTTKTRPGVTAPAGNLFAVHPAETPAVPNPPPGLSASADGRPHPQVYALGFSADATTDLYVNDWDTDFAKIRLKGTGQVTLNKNGVAASGPYTGAGLHVFPLPVHYSVAVPDDWSLTVSGVTGAFSVTVSEL